MYCTKNGFRKENIIILSNTVLFPPFWQKPVRLSTECVSIIGNMTDTSSGKWSAYYEIIPVLFGFFLLTLKLMFYVVFWDLVCLLDVIIFVWHHVVSFLELWMSTWYMYLKPLFCLFIFFVFLNIRSPGQLTNVFFYRNMCLVHGVNIIFFMLYGTTNI